MPEDGQLRLHNLSIKIGERTSSISTDLITKNTSRNFNENVDRQVDQTRHSDTQRLTAAERARLLGDIDGLRNDIAATYYADRVTMKGQAADDRLWALDIQEKVDNATNARLDWANQQIADRLAAQQDALARTAGSSHNCYVQFMTDVTMRDAMNQRAAIFADMDAKAIAAETEGRDRAFREGVAARLDSNDKEWTHDATQWGLLKDALMTHDEQQHTSDITNRLINENINESTTAFRGSLTGRAYAQDNATNEGTYAGDAGSFGITPYSG
jgi:hypothetical protein